MKVALMRNDGTMYQGFYDRQLVVTVTSEPGSPSSTIPEDKRIIPDDNILSYEIMPGMSDRIIRVSVSKFYFILKLPALYVHCCLFFCSLLWAGVQPTSDPSIETLRRSSELAQVSTRISWRMRVYA